jgi:hypothetical protein
MSEMLFDVIFKGKFSNQLNKIQAVNNFAKLFKQAPDKAVLFFDGKERALKKSLPMDKANHLRAVLKKAGLRVTLEKLATPEDSNVQSTLKQEWSLELPGSILAKKEFIPVPEIDISGLELDSVGARMDFKDFGMAAEFDFSNLSLDEVGAIFAEKEIIEVPEFDIDDIEIEEVGAIMGTKVVISEPEFDLEGLDIEAAGSVLPQPEKPKKPDINTDNIKLE